MVTESATIVTTDCDPLEKPGRKIICKIKVKRVLKNKRSGQDG